MFKFNKVTACLFTTILLSACSSTEGEHVASHVENNAKAAFLKNTTKQAFEYNTKDLEVAPYYYTDDFYVLGGAFEMTEQQNLPPVFDMNMDYSRVDKMDIDAIVAQVNKMYQNWGVVINVDESARDYIKGELASGASTSGSGNNIAASNDSTTNTSGIISSTGITPISTLDTSSLQGYTSSTGFTLQLDSKESSLRKILDYIAAATNTWWKYENGRATLYRLKSETFIVDASNKAYSDSYSASTNTNTEDSSSTTGSSYNSTATGKTALEGVSEQIGLMLSKDGEVYINTFDRSVTVKDTPAVLKDVRQFLKKYNIRSTAMIAMKVNVFEVITEVNDNKNIDWSSLFETDGFGSIVFSSPSLAANPSYGSITASASTGNWNIDSLAEFINRHSSIYSQISKMAKTKNGVPAIVTTAQEQGIVSGRSASVTSDSVTTESIETSLIDQGFTIHTTPRLTSLGKIDIDITVNTKTINDIQSFGSEDNEVQLEASRKQGESASVVLKDGQSSIVTAYEHFLTEADLQSLAEDFPWWAGGYNQKRRYKASLVIVVQPTIMEL
ncbi:hypothetical protein [Vibrio sp. Hal054]|uniref:hypothetical protein n=1 Tax=Vibrio sp. Hal054 TaxID=3035158 RepID=UPI00301DFB10